MTIEDELRRKQFKQQERDRQLRLKYRKQDRRIRRGQSNAEQQRYKQLMKNWQNNLQTNLKTIRENNERIELDNKQLKKLEAELDQKRNELLTSNQAKDNLEIRIVELEAKIVELRNELRRNEEKAEKNHEEAKAIILEFQKRNKDYKDANNAYSSFVKEQSALLKQQDDMIQEKIDKITDLSAELSKLKQREPELVKLLENQQRFVVDLEAQIVIANEAIFRLNRVNADLLTRIDRQNQIINGLKATNNTLNSYKDNVEAELERLTQELNNKQPGSEEDKILIKELEEKIVKLQSQSKLKKERFDRKILNYKLQITDLNEQIDNFKENSSKELKQLQKQLQECLDKQSKVKESLSQRIPAPTSGPKTAPEAPIIKIDTSSKARDQLRTLKLQEVEIKKKINEITKKLSVGEAFVIELVNELKYLTPEYENPAFMETWDKYFKNKNELKLYSRRFSKLFEEFASNPAYLRQIFLIVQKVLIDLTNPKTNKDERIYLTSEDLIGQTENINKPTLNPNSTAKQLFNDIWQPVRYVKGNGPINKRQYLSEDEIESFVRSKLNAKTGIVVTVDAVRQRNNQASGAAAMTKTQYVTPLLILPNNPEPSPVEFINDIVKWRLFKDAIDKEVEKKEAEESAKKAKEAMQNRPRLPFSLPNPGQNGLRKVKPRQQAPRKLTDMERRRRVIEGEDLEEVVRVSVPPVSKFVPRLSTKFIKKWS